MNVPSLISFFMLVGFSATAADLPEVIRAREVFLEIYKNREQFTKTSIPTTVFATGYKAFFNGVIEKSHLPKGRGWSWNQSNKKIEINLEINDKPVYRTIIRKFNQRGCRDNKDEVPSLKLWVFTMFKIDDEEPYGTAIWCAKGIDGVAENGHDSEGPHVVLSKSKELSLENELPLPTFTHALLPSSNDAILPTVIDPPSTPFHNITGRKRLFDEHGNNALEIFAMTPLIEYGLTAGEEVSSFVYRMVTTNMDMLLLCLCDQVLDVEKWAAFVDLARSHGISNDHAFKMARIVFRNAFNKEIPSQNNDNVF